MADALLSLKKVRAGYGDAMVLHDVTLDVPENGALALLGRNGVGKSTLLMTIMGYTQMRGGEIVVARQRHFADAAAQPRPRRHRLGGAGARNLPVAQRRGKPHHHGAARKVGPRRRLQDVSAAERTPPQHGQPAFRW